MIDTPVPGPREFNTTHWSLVGAAQSDEASRTIARTALEELCRAYWYPLYVFVRNRGHAPADAQDLTQAFFAQFITTGGFASADRERGRFRTYLLGAMKHFLANDWHRARSQKRGGGVTFLEWDALDPETRYALEPQHSTEPEKDYDRPDRGGFRSRISAAAKFAAGARMTWTRYSGRWAWTRAGRLRCGSRASRTSPGWPKTTRESVVFSAPRKPSST